MKPFFLVSRLAQAIGAALITATAAQAAGTAALDEAPQNAKQWAAAGRIAVLDRLYQEPNTNQAKNVILFVGDGMGISTVTAARILEGQRKGIDGEFNRLSFERFPYAALSVTASANQQTSDSAPTATAMVTGVKTNDGAISVDQTIERSEANGAITKAKRLTTIMELAEDRQMSTGVVSTARITHATPAVNYAHIANRDWEDNASRPAGATVRDIARQLVEFPYGDGIDVILGGGRSYFYQRHVFDPEYPTQRGRRTDGRNLIELWGQRYEDASYVWNKEQFDAIDPASTDKLLGLFERSHMRYNADRELDAAGEPTLAEMTEKAIKVLQKNPNGFYLMVEAGRIDHAHHAGNAYRALDDTIALSEAVAMAKALTNDEDTLIIVTADHSHVFTIGGYPDRGNPILGKSAVNGVPQRDALGLPYTTLSYANGPGWTGGFQRKEMLDTERTTPAAYIGGALRPDLTTIDTTAPGYMQEATVPMGSETHAGEEVGIYASGPYAHLFRGVMEQNTIFHVMTTALGIE